MPRPSGAARIDDDGEVGHRRLDQFLGAVARGGVEKQRVSGFQQVAAVGMPVAYLAAEHVDELHAGVAKVRVGDGVALQRDQVWLDGDVAADGMSEQVVQVSSLGPAPFDSHTGASLDEGAVALFTALPEQPADGNVQGFRQSRECRERG